MAEPTSPMADPLAVWREWVAQSERQWNAFLNQAMATDQYSQSIGRFMDLYLAMQKSLAETMGRYLAALNVPSRTDLLALGDRLSAIEERLARIESSLGRVGPDRSPSAADRPPRTRRPPSPMSGWLEPPAGGAAP